MMAGFAYGIISGFIIDAIKKPFFLNEK